jgi:hypothetical protein
MSRVNGAFTALVATQGAHSIEEYLGRLWESFPPARFLTGLIASDRAFGFIVLNAALVALGIWCALVPVRQRWPSASSWIWCWVVLETINGVVHLAWSLRQGSYTPGVLTAPLLLGLALFIASTLRRQARSVAPAA